MLQNNWSTRSVGKRGGNVASCEVASTTLVEAERVSGATKKHLTGIRSLKTNTIFHLLVAMPLVVVVAMTGCSARDDSRQKKHTSTPATLPPQSEQGLDSWPQSQGSAIPQPLVIDVDPTSEIGNVIRSVFQDSRGRLWIGGEGDLFRNDGKVITSYDVKDDLGNGVTIKCITEDHEGNIWCGTSGGITRIDGNSFTSLGEKDGLISRDVWSMAVDNTGTLWIGTIAGACRFDGKSFTPFAIPEAEPDPTRGVTSGKIVHCIAVDRKGHMWFGTNGGAYRYDGKSLTNISEKDGLSNNAVASILEDQSGDMWFGTTHQGICRFDGKAFTNFTKDGIIDGQEIWCMHEDRSGNIWFSGKHFGVYRYDGKSFAHYDEKDGLASPGMICMLEDKQGRLWLGGVNGLFRFDGESFFKVTKYGPWQ